MKGHFTPVIPRDLRLEVPERMDARGRILTPLDEAALRVAINQLIASGCEALVIHFLHSYANPSHERRAAEIAAELWPNRYITCGHALLSESREYERGVTAAVNAAVQPLLERYIARLTDELKGRGYSRELLVMNGNGGMVSSRSVAREAVKTVMSGPASGVMAAVCHRTAGGGCPTCMTYDMGGTSTDVAMIRDGRAPVSNEIEVEYAMPIHVPMVDGRTVGAGGGSIARIDQSGMLRIGPESAGSTPGPICYGRGGTRVMISDANLLLGRRPELDLSSLIDPNSRSETVSAQTTRRVSFGDWVEPPVYWRDHLPLSLHLQGPAIIEQKGTTLIVDPGCSVISDTGGNLIIEVPHA
jgi:N-methylhydantoinase A